MMMHPAAIRTCKDMICMFAEKDVPAPDGVSRWATMKI